MILEQDKPAKMEAVYSFIDSLPDDDERKIQFHKALMAIERRNDAAHAGQDVNMGNIAAAPVNLAQDVYNEFDDTNYSDDDFLSLASTFFPEIITEGMLKSDKENIEFFNRVRREKLNKLAGRPAWYDEKAWGGPWEGEKR